MITDGRLDADPPLDGRRFTLSVRRLADSLEYGTDRSPFLGAGIEFVQSRPYQWGDPVRSIDWRATARTGRVHVKEYEAPRRIPCWLLLDTSASMTVSSTAKSKYRVGLQIAGGLALACLNRMSPVGLLGAGERELRVEPSLSSAQIMLWLHQLRKFRHDESTRLGRRLGELAPALTQRHLLLVVSDLHDPEALPALSLLAQRHDCAVIQVIDPAEEGIPGGGFLRAREAETGFAFVTRASRPRVDPAAVTRPLRRAGIDHLAVRTDEPYASRLRHFCRSRDLLGRGSR